ncbi:MAG: hypothetical protein M1836_002011 [Candelina mexicana]|nr:MAG: hypothetical protein M1836_002011 [Candelina mexicana]
MFELARSIHSPIQAYKGSFRDRGDQKGDAWVYQNWLGKFNTGGSGQSFHQRAGSSGSSASYENESPAERRIKRKAQDCAGYGSSIQLQSINQRDDRVGAQPETNRRPATLITAVAEGCMYVSRQEEYIRGRMDAEYRLMNDILINQQKTRVDHRAN